MPRFRLTVSYDGTCFAGSQVQPNQRTVQGELEQAIAGLVGVPVRTTFAGRTDRGVHAAGQVAAVDLPSWRGLPAALERAINANLPPDLTVRDARECASSFHPRFDAVWREYRYWIAPSVVSPFVSRYAWTPRADVDEGAISAAAKLLIGARDFATFASRGEGVPWSERAQRPLGTRRTVFRCDCRRFLLEAGPGIDAQASIVELRIAADGFLPRMVRNIVGALVEVGQGRRPPEWMAELLAAKDRRSGAAVAPAQGLILWKIGFDGDELNDW